MRESKGIVGSSPLSRGIPRTNSSRCTCPRIIPALAGNTRSPGCIRICSRDHPRSRGEYMLPWWKPCWTRGSSPLSRGILCFAGNGCSRGGIIPALAGNTTGYAMLPGRLRDHPRSRGEYYWHTGKNKLCIGSSPLSRGIQTAISMEASCSGIIPALAGNTHLVVVPERVAEDHPRSRGEYRCGARTMRLAAGSSPLSRGIRCGVRGDYAQRRIIPALAGNTRGSGDLVR